MKHYFPVFLHVISVLSGLLNIYNLQVDFEDQLHEAFSAGLTTYSGKRTWGFWDAVAFSMTTVSTIGALQCLYVWFNN